MNELEELGEDLTLSGLLVTLLYRENKEGRAELNQLHAALRALDRAGKRYDKVLLENYKRK